jgi:hypothetical protein
MTLPARAVAIKQPPASVLERVEPPGDVVGSVHRVLRMAGYFRPQHTGDGSLFDHLAAVTAVQAMEDIADGARLLDQRTQVIARALLAGCQPEHGILEPRIEQVVLQRALVLEVLLRLAAQDLVERGLGDEDMTAVDDVAHLLVEEREQQRADMRAVDIGVGRDDDLVVAQLVGTGADSGGNGSI